MPKRKKINSKSDAYFVGSLKSLLGLALLLLLALPVYFFVSTNSPDDGAVLSSGKGSDGDGGDEDNSGSGSSDDEDDDDDEDENDDDDDEDEDEDDDDDEDDEDDDDDDEIKTRETVTNSDGTTSEIRREVKDGEEKIRIRTFNQAGGKIEDRKIERDVEDGEEEIRVKTYDGFGVKLSDLRLETEDGKEIELRVKEGETLVSRVEYDVEKQELDIRTGDDNEEIITDENTGVPRNRLRIRTVGNNFELSRSGVGVLVNFPITIDDETGQIFVVTPVGDVELRAMPDSIVQKASLNRSIDQVEEVALVSSQTPVISPEDGSGLKYQVQGVKSERFLGVFNLQLPISLFYDANNGSLIDTEQTFITRVLDLFSF